MQLYNGNCMDVLKQINIQDNAVIVTDPPFNIGYHYNQYKDNMDDEKILWYVGIFA